MTTAERTIQKSWMRWSWEGEREAQTLTRWLEKFWCVTKCTARPGRSEEDLFAADVMRHEKMDQQFSMAALWLRFLVQKPNTTRACVCVITNHSERGQCYKTAWPFEVWPYKWFFNEPGPFLYPPGQYFESPGTDSGNCMTDLLEILIVIIFRSSVCGVVFTSV